MVTAAVITAIGAVAAATGATISAVDQYRQSKANAKSEQNVANYNARVSQLEGQAAEQQAAENSRRQLVMARREQSQRIAQYGASGAALNSGSPLALLGQAAADASVTANDTLHQGSVFRSSKMSEAYGYQYQGRLARGRAMGKSALTGSIIGSWGQAASSIGSSYAAAKGGK